MTHRGLGFKRGATSVYTVIICMLLLSVITASFIRIIIHEADKTTDDDLAQSAYDSALAGVEDAKIALKRYYDCVATLETSDSSNESEEVKTCRDLVVPKFEAGLAAADAQPGDANYGYCDAVGEILGRIKEDDAVKEVLIRESSDTEREGYEYITQAYTCVTIDNTLGDFRSALDASTAMRFIPLKTLDPDVITGVRISWFTNKDGDLNQLSYANSSYFYPYGQPTATPPTLSVRLIQTAPDYTIADLYSSSSAGTTDNGTVFLVPTNDSSAPTHIGNTSNSANNPFVTSNDHSSTNYPQKVYCNKDNDEFACRVSLVLPKPNGSANSGARNPDTFYLVLDLPYDQPKTTFSVELCKDAQGTCEGDDAIAEFVDAQIAIDATGRASNLYSRVEARVEFNDIFYPFPRYALETTSGDADAIRKNFYVTYDCMLLDDDGSVSEASCNNSDTDPFNTSK